MSDQPRTPSGHLPRLAPGFYQGDAVVFWTHTLKNRTKGWLTPTLHITFRELMLHAAARESLLCPIYVLMPDHLHLVWMGLSTKSDQRRATAFLRPRLSRLLAPHTLQHQAHDHVLREAERKQGAFAATCAYIAENPMRASLAESSSSWPFTGCIVPGYPDLNPLDTNYWDRFWKIHNALKTRGLGNI